MASLYKYDTETGLVTPDTSTIQQDVQSEFRVALGQTLDVSPQTPQGRLIEAETTARSNVLSYNAFLANQINPDEAGGVFLAAIGSLMGSSPFPATPSTVPCRIYGTQGTLVSAGLTILDTELHKFSLQSDTTIAIADLTKNPAEYYAEGVFQCQTLGPIPVSPNISWDIVAPIPAGVTKVTNVVYGTPGVNKETDVAYRNRRKAMLAAQGSNTVRSAIANVAQLAGHKSVKVRENDTDANATIDGVVVPKKSIWVCVQGAENAKIAEALLEAKNGGCAWSDGGGSAGTPVSVTMTEPASGQSYNIKFSRPELVGCRVEVWYDPKLATGNFEPQLAIQDAIMKYQNGELAGDPGMTLGRNLSAFELSGAISTIYPGLYISAIKLYKGVETTAQLEIAANLWQVLNIPVGAIKIFSGRPV